jgi:hypothetical protein
LLEREISRWSATIITADIEGIEGRPVAKRGRIPRITDNPRLQKAALGSG